MNSIINNKWKSQNKSLPGYDCIVYANGVVTMLNVQIYSNAKEGKKTTCILPLYDTTIDDMIKDEEDIWTAVDEWSVLTNENGIYLSGDGAMGNEGFIAHTDFNNNLIWGMFFTETNPIKDLKIVDDILIGQSEHNNAKIEVNLNQITDITFTYYEIW